MHSLLCVRSMYNTNARNNSDMIKQQMSLNFTSLNAITELKSLIFKPKLLI